MVAQTQSKPIGTVEELERAVDDLDDGGTVRVDFGACEATIGGEVGRILVRRAKRNKDDGPAKLVGTSITLEV